MNARIKELAEQAGWIEGYYELDDGPFIEPEFNKEKFAELIIRECCLQVADIRIENDFEPVGDVALVQAITGIKKYFGVNDDF